MKANFDQAISGDSRVRGSGCLARNFAREPDKVYQIHGLSRALTATLTSPVGVEIRLIYNERHPIHDPVR